MQTKTQAMEKLKKSKFRSRFRLSQADRDYIYEKGMETIRMHAADFVRLKLAPAHPDNEGKQTPWTGHPVFKAMHATAFCCRGCMNKWYRVREGVTLSLSQQERIVNMLMTWIEEQYRMVYRGRR